MPSIDRDLRCFATSIAGFPFSTTIRGKWNLVNTDTKGTCLSVCIARVSVSCGLSDVKWRRRVLSIKELRQTFLRQQNASQVAYFSNKAVSLTANFCSCLFFPSSVRVLVSRLQNMEHKWRGVVCIPTPEINPVIRTQYSLFCKFYFRTDFCFNSVIENHSIICTNL